MAFILSLPWEEDQDIHLFCILRVADSIATLLATGGWLLEVVVSVHGRDREVSVESFVLSALRKRTTCHDYPFLSYLQSSSTSVLLPFVAADDWIEQTNAATESRQSGKQAAKKQAMGCNRRKQHNTKKQDRRRQQTWDINASKQFYRRNMHTERDSLGIWMTYIFSIYLLSACEWRVETQN